MKCKHKSITHFRIRTLAAAILVAQSSAGLAAEFNFGEAEISLQSNISAGASWRVEKQSDYIVNKVVTNNDGTKNYKKGDIFSKVIKGSHDLEIRYDNFGAFFRGKYWYDFELEGDDRLDDSDNHDLAKFSGIELLDAYVYGEFELGDVSLDARLGKQVLNWGESTFIQGGVNATNPFDVSAFRRPGATLKEALIPVNMASISLGLTGNLSLDAFYMLEFRETVIEGCGTYFSTNDYVGPGCGNIVARVGDDGKEGTADDIIISKRQPSVDKPGADGQYGFALRYYAEELDTEFGLYHMNLHSRVPTVSGDKVILDEQAVTSAILGGLTPADGNAYLQALQANAEGIAQVIAAAGLDGTFRGPAAGLNGVIPVTPMNYYVEYPEDIGISGFSFSTNAGGLAISGEISHKTNVPVQINDDQLITLGVTSDFFVNVLGVTTDPAQVEFSQVEDGGYGKGFREFDVSQAQVTLIQTFDQILGASRFSLVGEAGYTYIHDFDDSADAKHKYDGSSPLADGSYPGTTTQESWGYRLNIAAEYNDVFSGVSLKPSLYWSDDVSGFSPTPGGNFFEGSQKLGTTLRADYIDTYYSEISYTRFDGPRTQYDIDRDFVSLTVGMNY